MTTISGFTFIHNAIESGYPIVEAIKAVQPYVDEVVVVNMQSTDNTRQVLEQLDVRVIDGFWGTNSGQMLDVAYREYIKCSGDIIVHFEADEVYDDGLIQRIVELITIENGQVDIAVYRLQIEQNFQRCKWYPEPVHRVFARTSHTRKEGHTSNRHQQAMVLGTEVGYLWDISNCFRDNWLRRIEKMAEYRSEEANYLMVPQHCILNVKPTRQEVELKLGENHWTWTVSPFRIPEILRPLIGMTKYEAKI